MSGSSRRLVVGVRCGPLPDRLECGGAELEHRRIGGQLDIEPLTLAAEVIERDDPIVEHPEVVARQREIRRAAARQPADLLARRDVESVRDLVEQLSDRPVEAAGGIGLLRSELKDDAERVVHGRHLVEG